METERPPPPVLRPLYGDLGEETLTETLPDTSLSSDRRFASKKGTILHGNEEAAPVSTCTPPPQHNRGRSPGRAPAASVSTQTLAARRGWGGGRGTHQLADPVQVVQEVLHRLALRGETHTAQSRPRGPGPAGRTRVGTLWSPWRREGVHGHLRLTLLSQNGRFSSSNPQIQTQTLAQWPCPVPAGAGPSGQATGPARRGSTVRGRHPSEGLGHVPGRSPAADEVTHCAAHASPAVRLRAAEGRRVWPLDTGPACPGRSAQPQGRTRLRLGRPQCRLRPPGVLWTDRPGRLPPGRRRTSRTAQAVSGEPGHPRQRH